MLAPAFVALLAAVSGGDSFANEPVEDEKTVRQARFISNKEIQDALQKLARPSGGPALGGDPFSAQEDLKVRIQRILPMLERLETMKGGYAHLESLGPVEGERAEVRAGLVAEQAAFNEASQRFNELRKQHQTRELQDILIKGKSAGVQEKISRAMELEHFSDEIKDVRLKTAAVLADDEDAFKKAAQELQRRRRQAAAAAGGAGVLGAAAFGLWLWRRRGPRKAPASPAAPSGALSAGALVGRNFRIERELGRGGMGLVYEATDLALRRKVAVKQMRSELRENPKDLGQFMEEARLVASLKHPNVVEIHSIVDEGGEVYLVFEFVAGNTLNSLLQRSPRLALPSARGLLDQIGSALDYAHGQKVIHRDLKPANVMVTAQGAVKVMDFGLAHQAQQTVARQTRAESWGTPPYMAPEQELGTVSRESDLYSLAVLFYESLTGKLPFPGPNYLAQKRELRFIPASHAAPGLPSGLDSVFSRALHPDPAKRFHSAAEFTGAVDFAAGS
ncbi:MAG: serine/threonine protein kinase [Elusimicrobia bacterium]|nr:serine/threonine protein kinase [Elusimicrobiota bacterium]